MTGISVLMQVAMKYVKKYGVELIRVLTLTKNRGKGGAVRLVNRLFSVCSSICTTHCLSLIGDV